jgi:hypothetical protein
MLGVARIIVVDGRIGRREPSLKLLLQLISCEWTSALTVKGGTVEE